MITKSDFDAVRHQMTADESRTLGEPPPFEVLLAYSRGELSEVDAEPVRDWLVCNPKVARALVQPFPDDGAKLGDDAFLSHAELENAWGSLQARLHGASSEVGPASRRLKFPERWLAVAAAGVLVFGGLFWQSENRVRQLEGELHTPRVLHAPQTVYPDATRRGTPAESTLIVADEEDVLLELKLSDASRFEEYRLHIADARTVPTRSLWKSAPAAADDEGSISMLIPRRYLGLGRYRIGVYGVKGGREELLDTYTVLMAPR
jgi:hypothetical protein